MTWGYQSRVRLALYASVAAITSGMPVAAPAQVKADAQARTFLVPAQPALTGVTVFARQANVQVLIVEEAVGERNTNRVEGSFSVEEGLRRLLRNSGLKVRQTAPGTFLVELDTLPKSGPAPVGTGAIPDILVTGKKGWSLNTGIARTQNDSQPFIVLDQKTIKRSGAPNLETFLRDQLSVNASAATAEQVGGFNVGRSVVNLRGLGERETLILVDGRRMPGINTGGGVISQADISAIPLDSIERIEVLASSASGIYGSGATGGVINIVLRRDYNGFSLTGTRGGTFAGGRDETRIDLTSGISLEDGRTNVTLSASWRDARPLRVGDRPEFLTNGRRFALANNPNAYQLQPPLGATPNILGLSGAPLTLDAEYGGGTLPYNYTSIPLGYRGVAIDGVAPLVANAGRYALDLADTGQALGTRSYFLAGTRQLSATLAVRREFSSWLKLYAEAAGTRSTVTSTGSRAPTTIFLAADAPNNPFTGSINVSVPQIGADRFSERRTDQLRGLVGAIVQFGGGWQGVLDLQRSKTTVDGSRYPPSVDGQTVDAMRDGSIDVLRDLRLSPVRFGYLDSIYGASYQTPSSSRLMTVSARVAGPIPLKLPGGRPQLTVNLEHSMENSGSVKSVQNDYSFSRITLTPSRSQRIESVYTELSLPLIGTSNTIPFVREFEVKLAARHERYKGVGADADIECFLDFGPLPDDGIADDCPAAGMVFARPAARNQHTDPSISARWQVISDLTFRASYATGYLPPTLNRLVKVQELIFTDARDPERGGETIGTPISDGYSALDGFTGGNPDVKPESSKTFTMGVIIQPRFMTGLRLSADWTRITKKDNYFDPDGFLDAPDAAGQAAFENFIRLYPDRVVRGPATDGATVGPITSIDVSTANLSGSRSEAVDFVADYTHALFGGTIDFSSRATWVRELSVRQFPNAPVLDYTGVSDDSFQSGLGDIGSVRWKGVASLNWSNDRFGVGWQTRFTDGYYVNLDRSVAPSLGSARVASQTYHDLNVRYTFDQSLTLRASVNNVFNKAPPIDTSVQSQIYSKFGDPRRASYALTINKSF